MDRTIHMAYIHTYIRIADHWWFNKDWYYEQVLPSPGLSGLRSGWSSIALVRKAAFKEETRWNASDGHLLILADMESGHNFCTTVSWIHMNEENAVFTVVICGKAYFLERLHWSGCAVLEERMGRRDRTSSILFQSRHVKDEWFLNVYMVSVWAVSSFWAHKC